LKDLTRQDFIMALRARRAQLINAMTPEKMAEAGVRDLAIAIGTLQDKEALLLGEPTSIVGFERKEQINELTAKLLEEAKRRGLTELKEQADGSYAPGGAG
jgi:ABC-type cobalamin/Fe3+-siderophores transport system ATPase subunit